MTKRTTSGAWWHASGATERQGLHALLPSRRRPRPLRERHRLRARREFEGSSTRIVSNRRRARGGERCRAFHPGRACRAESPTSSTAKRGLPAVVARWRASEGSRRNSSPRAGCSWVTVTPSSFEPIEGGERAARGPGRARLLGRDEEDGVRRAHEGATGGRHDVHDDHPRAGLLGEEQPQRVEIVARIGRDPRTWARRGREVADHRREIEPVVEVEPRSEALGELSLVEVRAGVVTDERRSRPRARSGPCRATSTSATPSRGRAPEPLREAGLADPRRAPQVDHAGAPIAHGRAEGRGGAAIPLVLRTRARERGGGQWKAPCRPRLRSAADATHSARRVGEHRGRVRERAVDAARSVREDEHEGRSTNAGEAEQQAGRSAARRTRGARTSVVATGTVSEAVPRSRRAARGARRHCAARSCCGVRAGNGETPVRSTWRVTPRE